ncbi:MAG: hypothetical protein ACYCO3_06340, partial [Mycobacteriales bacterium]
MSVAGTGHRRRWIGLLRHGRSALRLLDAHRLDNHVGNRAIMVAGWRLSNPVYYRPAGIVC